MTLRPTWAGLNRARVAGMNFSLSWNKETDARARAIPSHTLYAASAAITRCARAHGGCSRSRKLRLRRAARKLSSSLVLSQVRCTARDIRANARSRIVSSRGRARANPHAYFGGSRSLLRAARGRRSPLGRARASALLFH